ncbi:MAG: glycosyltransferase family protein [Candidatus Nitrosotenuis sp.]
MANLIGIIQARMSSTRLAGKVMLPLINKPILWHIHHRFKKCNVDQICIATSTNPNDDQIEKFAANENIRVFRGSENLVLDRLISTAEKFHADAIVRITADCPLFDPQIVNEMISIYKNHQKIDFVSNTIERTFPDGLDSEIMSLDFLYKLSDKLKDPFYREWFPAYIVENCNRFNYVNFKNKENLSHLRWTVDFPEDYEFVKIVYEELFPNLDVFSMQDILDLLNNKPEISIINQKYSSDTSTITYRNLKRDKSFSME